MPLNFACDFEDLTCIVYSTTGESWDVSLIVDEINVHECVFNPTCTAEIVFDDANNYLNNIPITGHEKIEITFRTPNKGLIIHVMRIVKVDCKQLEKERRTVYVAHCISEQEFTNAKTRVSKAYKGKLISEIAADIQSKYLDSSFIELETTKFKYHIIPAYWTPIYAINFLTGRAQSTSFEGANYVYYQNNDGFHFVSLEKLCSQGTKIRYYYQPANVRQLNSQDDIVYVPEETRTLSTDEVAVQSYAFKNNFDTLENINNGMYSSRLLWHDIRLKQYDDKDWDYPSTYPEYIHVESAGAPGGGGLSYLWTSQSDQNSKPFGAHRHYPIGQPNQETYCKFWMQPRISQLQQIQNVRLFITAPGDSDRRVGDIVEFYLPSPEQPLNNQLILDKYYQGRYLVVSLKHRVIKSQYTTIMELASDSVFTAYP